MIIQHEDVFRSVGYFLQICKESQNHEDTLSADSGYGSIDKDLKINQLFKKIQERIPKVTFTHMDNTTSAKKSRAILLNHKAKYCIGDPLTVQLDMYDYLGNRKKYGGDFLRARIYSPDLNASASGRIDDLNNGTYLAHFTLFWEGLVQVSILLMHPSEGVAALWRARNEGYENIIYTGMFTNTTEEVYRECGFHLDTTEDVCKYLDHRDGECFFCIKPPNLPCEALTHMNSVNSNHTYFSNVEEKIFNRSNIGIELPNRFQPIRVVRCNKKGNAVQEKCKIGTRFPFPGGYFLHDVWYPLGCSMHRFKTGDQITNCLQGKKVYLIGDSTLRQFIKHLTETLNIMMYFNHTENELQSWQKTLVAINMEKSIHVQWKKHTFPFVSKTFYSVKEDTYAARQIDQIGGGHNTILVLTLGQHLRPFPFSIFLRRAINIRRAIERLFYRSPDTTVIIKEENARDMDIDMERFSDFHGYLQYITLKEIFQDLNVGFIDALDMTIAYASDVIHPPLEVLENLISMCLTYVC
ncbi:NXPE family member 2-like isoform X2 [Rhinatrema bivittatum]|uniref:NXPE family member 2-like isoform X2 n=1 Tax=Rhinatrema bivittatum TaxID=194408 RepID=UPI0011283932|nr:NXPE family member 2-like isoform X2 [Rhinatrema bivittatum]XP_029429677.1 NXPE family member 2-like isoform X2 [Rhinatrema bivittatum]XP_029429679.1 NXPE family member 2-like isoform X2 [Rhinatrema bivittatum]